jgi:hypothetical protein
VDNDAKDDEYIGFGCCDYCLIGISYFIGLLTFPIFVIMSIKIVKEYERAVIMRLGKYRKLIFIFIFDTMEKLIEELLNN